MTFSHFVTPRRPVAVACASLALAGMAQAATPDAGSLLRQLQPADDARLTQPATAPKLQIRKDDRVELVDRTPFALVRLEFKGQTRITEAELQQLAAGMTGREVTLAELDGLTRKITALYRSRGYPLARALVPTQTIQGGVVRIDIYEATLGAIQLRNSSAVGDATVLRQVSGLKPGDPITDEALEQALLLVADLPALRYEAVLSPGQAVGTTDLELSLQNDKAGEGSVGLDNFGSAATGRERLKASYTRFNPFGVGDVLDLGVSTSGSQMAYARAAYTGMLPVAGMTGGVALSRLNYELGGALAPLGGNGTATQGSLWVNTALQRSVASSTYLRLQFDGVGLADNLDTAGVRNHRHIDLLSAELSGNVRSDGRFLWWTAAALQGRLSISDADARATDAATARSAGNFTKLALAINHLQALSAGGQFQLSASLQLASKNLDSSQKLQLGGSGSMRAYKNSAVSADRGALLSAEYRRPLLTKADVRWQGGVFVETASVFVSATPWSSTSANQVSLHGAGVSLILEASPSWQARATVASPLGKPAVANIDRSVKAWFEVSRRF